MSASMRSLPIECRRTRRSLTTDAIDGRRRSASHLEGCDECRAVADGLEDARRALAAPSARVAPGPEFAGRVVSRLPKTPDLLVWASLRVLPGAVALLLVLSWLSASGVPSRELLFDPVDEMTVMTYSADHLGSVNHPGDGGLE